eukprot:TRINITY_DN16633_c0_g1_i1.p1 TRINITY_DN16633_c0_g1~~TRINITY_DN16633_c0_g1_i1.p1  ORF type:complete len:683 (+),score=250.90 TRINITY_DN16633_c0_g1_i1:123-2171(+)
MPVRVGGSTVVDDAPQDAAAAPPVAEAARCVALPIRDGEKVMIASGGLVGAKGMIVHTMLDAASMEPRYAVLLDDTPFPGMMHDTLMDTFIVVPPTSLAPQKALDRLRLFPAEPPPPAAAACRYTHPDGGTCTSETTTVRLRPVAAGPPECDPPPLSSPLSVGSSRPYHAKDFPGVSLICSKTNNGLGARSPGFDALKILWTLFSSPPCTPGQDAGFDTSRLPAPADAAAAAAEEAPPPLNKYVGNEAALKAEVVQEGIDKYLTCVERLEDLFVAVDSSTQVAAVLRGLVRVLGVAEDVRNFAPTVETLRAVTTETAPSLTQEAIDATHKDLTDLSAASVWDVAPEAGVLLLWLRYMLKHCTVIHKEEADPAAAADAPPAAATASPRFTDDGTPRRLLDVARSGDADGGDAYGRDAWVQANGAAAEEAILPCLEGRWKTLKERTVVAVKGRKAAFSIGTSGFGSEWELEVRADGAVYLLGSRLKQAASTTHVLRWDDGDVWRRLEATDTSRMASPEPQFGLYSVRKGGDASPMPASSPGGPSPTRVRAPQRPATAPPARPTGKASPAGRPGARASALQSKNAVWAAEEAYTDAFVQAKLNRFADDRLHKIFAAMANGEETIHRNALDAFLSQVDYLEPSAHQKTLFVDRVLQTVPRSPSQPRDPHRITFEEFSIIMLRLEAR